LTIIALSCAGGAGSLKAPAEKTNGRRAHRFVIAVTASLHGSWQEPDASPQHLGAAPSFAMGGAFSMADKGRARNTARGPAREV
jgi:hypothetical protein